MTVDPFQLVGTVLDQRYRIEQVIGEGGFGVVYKAFHLGFSAPIAVKVLKVPAWMSSADARKFIETFEEEGKLLFSLSLRHPGFVRVTEKGATKTPVGVEAPYLVLEWLDGESLDADLSRRRSAGGAGRSLDELIRLLTPVAEALSIAHAQNVAHRDVKPANIFVVHEGSRTTTKLLDFGIAKVMASTGTEAMRVTAGRGGQLFSPPYSAPEQWDRAKYGATGPWTDVYAFALVCVEVLSNRPALEGEEVSQFMGATTSPTRPTPRSRGVKLPAGVEGVFRKALALRVADRYATLEAFWRALLTSAGAALPAEAIETSRVPASKATVLGKPLPEALDPLTARARTSDLPHPRSAPRTEPASPGSSARPWLVTAALAVVVIGLLIKFVGASRPVEDPAPFPLPTTTAPTTTTSTTRTTGTTRKTAGTPPRTEDGCPVTLTWRKDFSNTALRDGPSRYANEVKRVEKGDRAFLVGGPRPDEGRDAGRWYKVSAGGVEGWLHENSIEGEEDCH